MKKYAPSRPRSVRSLAIVLSLIYLGCASTATIPLPQPDPDQEIGIVGYKDADGTVHYLHGTATVSTDSVHLESHGPTPGNSVSVVTHKTSLPASEVSALRVTKFSFLKTMALVASPFVLWFVVFSLGGFQGSTP